MVLTLMGLRPFGGRFFSGTFQIQAEQDFRWGPRDGHWPVSWLWKLNLRFYSWSTASLTHAPAALRRTPDGSVLSAGIRESGGVWLMDAVGGSGLASAPPGRDTSWRRFGFGECTEQEVMDGRNVAWTWF